jgi:hypothetical protein
MHQIEQKNVHRLLLKMFTYNEGYCRGLGSVFDLEFIYISRSSFVIEDIY